ncbi:MAG: hypothetical protein M1511_18520 [Deltaproteobacteria bacterium]|nr:hypothetical protein [Deltaproteobacteria bacterium]
MANVLIANNVGRAARSCHPLSDNPEGEVQVLQWPTIKGEAQGLAEIIRTRIMNGEVEPGKVLVLAPRRYLGYAARDALKDLGINAHSFFAEEALDGDPKQFDKSNSQQALTLLMLLGNPEDRVALRCWCGFGSPSLQSSAWARLREYCKTSGDTPRTALERLAHGDLTIGRIGPLVQRFQKLQTRLAELGSVRGEALVDTLFPGDANWTSFVRSLASTIQGDEFDAQALSETRACRDHPNENYERGSGTRQGPCLGSTSLFGLRCPR